MAKTNNGGGPSKVPSSAEEQDQLRRAQKAKQRSHRKIGVRQVSSLTEDLFQDKLNQRGVAMLDFLDGRMTSASRESSELLAAVTASYVDKYTTGKVYCSWVERHRVAKATALGELTGGLQKFAERQLNAAEFATRPIRVDA